MSNLPPITHQQALDTLIAVGTALARNIQTAREAEEITPTEAADAFERVARATRRTVLLAAHLNQAPAAPARHTARRELIRAVEDAITREPRLDAPARAALEAEFRERLDAPELAEDLADRPVAAVLADVLHDLDLGRLPFTEGRNWRRRTPAAIRRLHARAAGHPAGPDDPTPDDPAPDDPAPDPAPPDPPLPLATLHRLILATP